MNANDGVVPPAFRISKTGPLSWLMRLHGPAIRPRPSLFPAGIKHLDTVVPQIRAMCILVVFFRAGVAFRDCLRKRKKGVGYGREKRTVDLNPLSLTFIVTDMFDQIIRVLSVLLRL